MGRRKRYFNFETRSVERIERKPIREIPRTPEARRKEIVDGYWLRRHGMDESWVVLGAKYGDWKLVSPENQRHDQMEQRRIETAKWYRVPVPWVWTEDELAKWRAARATPTPIDRFLTIIGSHAQASVKACLKIIPISLLWMDRN